MPPPTPDFESIFHSLPGLYLILKSDLTITAVSDDYLKATMTTREGILSRNIFDVFPDNPGNAAADGVKKLTASLNRVLQTKSADTMAVQRYDIRRPEKEGGGFEVRYWSPVNAPVLDKGTSEISYIVHRVVDVTEFIDQLNQCRNRNKLMEAEIIERNRELQEMNDKLRRSEVDLETRIEDRTEKLKRVQQQMVQQERLRALGEMATGIAHDFNNALSPILGYSELILDLPHVEETVRGYIKTINLSAKDAAGIVTRLRQFTKQREKEECRLPVHLNKLVDDTLKMTKPKWKNEPLSKGAEITVDCNIPETLFINGKEHELRELITNLIFNAVDAMPQGGTLRFKAEKEGGRIRFEISDTGSGMSPEVRQKCLEPFFTTKGDKGTGMGLAMVYGILQRHGAELEIFTELGKGTAFVMHFPAGEGVCEMKHPVEKGALVRSLTVLYAEDNPEVRKVIQGYLEHDGHRLDIASNGPEGLRKFYANHESYDLVITDFAMPGMTGEDMALAIRKRMPEQKIILLAGTSGETAPRKTEYYNLVLQKPVALAELRKALSDLFHP